MIRAVLDTNVIISGLLWNGPPRKILEAADEERLFLFTSRPLLEELAYVLQRPKFKMFLGRRGLDFGSALAQVVHLTHLIVPRAFSEAVVTEDPSDDMVLECAVTAAADMVVTGDEHLLALKKFRNIPILPPGAFLRILKNGHSPR